MSIEDHGLPAKPDPRRYRLHPAWIAFIGFCDDLRFGEIEKLKIQDGLPMIAEKVKKKIHFHKEIKSDAKTRFNPRS